MAKFLPQIHNKLLKHRKIFYVLLLIIFLLRFAQLNVYNWHHGNTGYQGVQILTDSFRYIEGAECLLKGCLPDYKQSQYIGYSLLIALSEWIGTSLKGVVVFQLLLALIASMVLYKLTFHFSKSNLASIIVSGMYLCNPFINSWHLYIMTESVYTSLLIITTFLLVRAIEKKQIKHYLLFVPVLLFTVTIRPNGWVLLPITIFFVLIPYLSSKYLKFLAFLVIFMFFIILLSALPFSRKAIDYIGTDQIRITHVLLNGEVIPDHAELRLSMPQDSVLATKSWTESFHYIVKHPIPCLKLAVTRIITELFQVNRPWLSTKYRLRLYLWLYPAYILAFIGLFYYRKENTTKIILAIVIMHLLTIALTFADHEGRFLNYFLPLIYVLCGGGITFVLEKLKKSIFLTKHIHENTAD